MNLDLNLGPLNDSSDDGELGIGYYPNNAVNLDDWLVDIPVPWLREAVRNRDQRWHPMQRECPIPPETQNLEFELIGGNTQPGDEQQHAEMPKMCQNGPGYTEHEVLGKRDDVGKIHSENGSWFDCNICLNLAKDPVVTCCGHLFCWPCIYQSLYRHSDANECPVCKGVVTLMNVTPIYGRGNAKQETNVNCNLQIPHRPQARRVESWRQTIQRSALTIPMEEMIRRLGSTYDLSRGLAQLQSQSQDTPLERSSTFNQIHTYRGTHGEWNPAPEGLVNVTERSSPNYEVGGHRQLSSMLLHRTNSVRTVTLSALNSDENPAAERLMESYFQSNPAPVGDLPLPLPLPLEDDRDVIVMQSGNRPLNNGGIELSTRTRTQDGELEITVWVGGGD